jgi:hypothetical protein
MSDTITPNNWSNSVICHESSRDPSDYDERTAGTIETISW